MNVAAQGALLYSYIGHGNVRSNDSTSVKWPFSVFGDTDAPGSFTVPLNYSHTYLDNKVEARPSP